MFPQKLPKGLKSDSECEVSVGFAPKDPAEEEKRLQQSENSYTSCLIRSNYRQR